MIVGFINHSKYFFHEVNECYGNGYCSIISLQWSNGMYITLSSPGLRKNVIHLGVLV